MEYEERLAQAKGRYAQGLERVKDNSEPQGQKFPCGSFVKIAERLPSNMSHFPCGIYARISYTYAHAYGGSDITNYSLVIQGDPRGWRTVAWYNEEQLTLITDEKIIAELTESIREYDNG